MSFKNEHIMLDIIRPTCSIQTISTSINFGAVEISGIIIIDFYNSILKVDKRN